MFFGVKTYEDFAAFLGVKAGAIRWYAYSSRGRAKAYRKFKLPKKGGGTRIIRAPTPGLYKIQRAILDKVLTADNIMNRRCVYSYTPLQGPLEMAGRHVSRDFVVRLDIEDFFGSITFPRVLGALQAFPLYVPYKWAVVMAQLCTCEGVLPQGAPTSPALSNLIARRMDGELITFAKENGFRYSRYSDDMIFSGSTRRKLSLLIEQDHATFAYVAAEPVRDIIQSNGFKVNDSKTRISFRQNRQMVVGAVCNQKVNVDRRYVRQVRTLINLAKKSQPDALDAYRSWTNRSSVNDIKAVLRGKIEYIRQIKGSADRVFVGLAESFNYAFPSERNIPIGSAVKSPDHRFNERHVLVCESFHKNYGDPKFGTSNEAIISRFGSGFFLEGLGFVTSFHNVLHKFTLFSASNPDFNVEIEHALYCDRKLDIAILDGSNFPKGLYRALRPEQVREVSPGEDVTLLGYPNYTRNDKLARIRAQVVQPRSRFGMTLYAIDAQIIEGCSGGPVVNERGRVVGIARSNNGENLLVPIKYVLDASKNIHASRRISEFEDQFVLFEDEVSEGHGGGKFNIYGLILNIVSNIKKYIK